MSDLKITKMPTNSSAKNVSQKTNNPYLKITKIPTTTSNVGKERSPYKLIKKENHAGGVTLDTNPEETCPEINSDNNNPVDELTYQDIPEENLIRLRGDGHLHCYDVTTLKRTVDQNGSKEPMTLIPLPDSIITMIKNHPAQYSQEVKESIALGRQQRANFEDQSFRLSQQPLIRRNNPELVRAVPEQQQSRVQIVEHLTQQQQQVRSQLTLARQQLSELPTSAHVDRAVQLANQFQQVTHQLRLAEQQLTPQERLQQERLAQLTELTQQQQQLRSQYYRLAQQPTSTEQREREYRQFILQDGWLTEQVQILQRQLPERLAFPHR